eukprot:TRINITY_DN1315_c0_g1_i1.p2 TRINITY_DN1315_c0_g1~~TRINITY_DN1315_c0_g1_i1.p2  ORF type:complete len:113 (-),score=14.60 TRINITY_DN1315_c0_g1_i1:439-777(-)
MSADIVPTDLRHLRACIVCSLIKTYDQFESDGCENCDEFISQYSTRVAQCTTTSFEGMIAMMIPSESWVAKWQRIVKYTPGMYAIAVHASLPRPVERELHAAGVKYQPRHPQ